MKSDEMIGRKFGALLVVRRSHSDSKNVFVVVRCECGVEKIVRSGDLSRGMTKSCGCQRWLGSHGMTKSQEWNSWRGMLERCRNPNHEMYKRYGGRGIVVCDRWSLFEHFFADMGRKPSRTHSIDRIDNNGNYEPGNCRWATKLEQARTCRVSLTAEQIESIRSDKRYQRDIAIEYGISNGTVWNIKRGLYRFAHKE